VVGGGISGRPGAPHHATARPGLAHTTRWCGGMGGPPWVGPGASLPPFRRKFNKKNWNFSRNFISGGFQKLIND
jgi:hypothetical protein